MAQLTTSLAHVQRTSTSTVRTLLTCGMAAGPIYVTVAAAQVLTRDGFDIRRHAVSQLSTGDLGWIQILSFVVTGLLTLAGAAGLRRTLAGTRGGTWTPRLLGVYGAGLVAAGLLVVDPALGFPAGTPDGPPVTVTWHGVGHFVAAGIGFLALIAACLVMARRYAALGRRGWAAWSAATGVLFFAAFAGVASGGALPGMNVAFTVAVVAAWTWVSVVSAQARRAAEDR